MSSRINTSSANQLRGAIREAKGVEVFAIGDVEGGQVVGVTITCRGQNDRVIALIDRPQPGQVVIHNHPSGNLTPSDADMQLAGIYGDAGIGFVIINSDVSEANWVVEPYKKKAIAVSGDEVEAFFRSTLPKLIPDFEPRPGQIDMAIRVAQALSEEQPLVVEAGTGTGKSLAYLVPAALWAKANESKVVISTHTKALQGQLLVLDLPILERAELGIRAAVLQGRNNYLCKRRLGIAIEEDSSLPPEERSELSAIAQWEEVSSSGSRSDLPLGVDPSLWERIESDTDLTLRVRCPHYASCHFYTARRRAAAAHLVVVNHALLLADRSTREAGAAVGILPKYERLILDEAHHLEEAATGAVSQRLSTRALDRAVLPLLSRKGRPGALERVLTRHRDSSSPLPFAEQQELEPLLSQAATHAGALKGAAEAILSVLSAYVLPEDGTPARITPEVEATENWRELVVPQVSELAKSLEDAAGALDPITALFAEVKLSERDAEPLLELDRARRRIAGHAEVARRFLSDSDEQCRWFEPAGARDRSLTLNLAPIEVAATLRKILWNPLPGTISTSATLTVAGQFGFWMQRIGAPEAETDILPSPFDHAQQALLALPRDLPAPDDDGFLAESARIVVEAVQASDGGAFVLCTSFAAVQAYGAALRRALPAEQPVLIQDAYANRGSLLDRFRENRRSVLVGTDSFWEGVSVKGEGLRLVVIPRLPFRVPTEPLRIARHEKIAQRGGDPFRSFSLPEAIIKLRQGYGRLIRHRGDRGVVLMLDRRIHDRQYGALMLKSLPPARRVSAPWARVLEEMKAFYRGESTPEPARDVQAFLARLQNG